MIQFIIKLKGCQKISTGCLSAARVLCEFQRRVSPDRRNWLAALEVPHKTFTVNGRNFGAFFLTVLSAESASIA
jgi:hypothetical protein